MCVSLHENGSGRKKAVSVLLVTFFRLNHNNSVMLCLHNEESEVMSSERQAMGKIPMSGTKDGSKA